MALFLLAGILRMVSLLVDFRHRKLFCLHYYTNLVCKLVPGPNLQSARGVPSLLETRRWGKMLLNTVNNHQLVSESSKTFVSECVDATLGTRGVFSRAAD